MTWLRSPTWDSVWIFSGLPIGITMLWAPTSLMIVVFFVINTAHVISPGVVAWSNHGFRLVMRERWIKFILVPLCILIAATATGATVGKTLAINPLTLGVRVYDIADYQRPFVLMLILYFFWNAYHFGAQNFGIVSLYKRGFRGWLRHVVKWSCVALTFAGMVVLPRTLRMPAVSLFTLGFFSFNHSLSAIGISSHVLANHYRRSPWLIACLLIVAGALACWLIFCAPGFTVRATMTVIGFRLGLGFVHFLYDRWIWKFSDPQVRATIGQDLFHRREAPLEVNYGVAR
jgi:hypothetical protein